MRRDKIQPCLVAAVLSFSLGYGGVACMVTGLKLDADLVGLAFCCALTAAVFAILLTLRRGGTIALGVAAASLVLLGMSQTFRQQGLSMLSAIFAYYDQAYDLDLPELLTGQTALPHLMPLLLIDGIVTLAVCWTLIRRYPAALAGFLSLIPMICCVIVTDTVPQLWCILMWLFGLVLMLISHPVRMRDAMQGVHLTMLMAIPVTAALIVLSVVVPQSSYAPPEIQISTADDLWVWLYRKLPFIGQTSSGELVISFGGDLPEQVDLDILDQRDLKSTPVMELETDFSGQIYLRGRDYDFYDGVSWQADPDRVEWDFSPPQSWTRPIGTVQVRMLSNRSHLYVPYYPGTSLTFHGGMAVDETGVTEYSFENLHLVDDWVELWRKSATGSDQTVDERYLELPEQTLADAQQILEDAQRELIGFEISGYADRVTIAHAIGYYVRSCARYDLDTDRMPSSEKDLAIWFLKEADTGYCVHFATAATVLLRAAGIPARYVQGYMTYAEEGKTTMIRENAAHAWVEFYVDGIGWMLLDPTPSGDVQLPTGSIDGTVPSETQATEPSVTEPTVTEPTVTDPTVTEDTTETDPVTDPEQPTGGTSPSGSGGTTGPSHDDPEPREPLPGWCIGLLTGLSISVVAILSVFLQWASRRRYKLRRMYRGKVNTQAMARFREARRLARLLKTPLPDELTRLAERACYSQHRLTPEELSRFDTFLRDSVAALRKKSWFHQLIYRLIWAAY